MNTHPIAGPARLEPFPERARRAPARFAGLAILAAAALWSAASCGTTRKAAPAAPTPVPTATPSLTPAPISVPMPVTTPSSSSIYDRTPGVIYEEKGRAPSTPAGATPTHAAPSGPSPTPTRRPAAAA
ncbi:MAG: hypothetical protein ABI592_15660 [Acidobacteriota bacterium]